LGAEAMAVFGLALLGRGGGRAWAGLTRGMGGCMAVRVCVCVCVYVCVWQACYVYDIGGPRFGQVIQKLEGHTDRVRPSPPPPHLICLPGTPRILS